MGFSIETSISALTVFLQGLLSFFSPCVLPLLPLYLGYLAGGAAAPAEPQKRRRVTLRNTLFFILGISAAFFLLGLGFSSVGSFFAENRTLIARIGGILIILLGIFQLGLLSPAFLNRELRLPFHLERFTMNPLTALLLGFSFSFSWTPCVGPALTSVLLMAGSAESRGVAFLLIGVYALGFVIPFLLVGLFTNAVLSFSKKHQSIVQFTGKAGGALMILIGVLMVTNWMNGFTGRLAEDSGIPSSSVSDSIPEKTASDDSSESVSEPESAAPEENTLPPAPDFTLTDQYGESHTLSDYKGKVVFLNFWATWCGLCKSELPDIEALYEDHEENSGDLIVLGIAGPKNDENPRSVDDKTEEEIKAFLEDTGVTYPVLMDTTGEFFYQYGISAYPTTFMIAADGSVFGYAQGALSREIMDDIIEQTRTGKRR